MENVQRVTFYKPCVKYLGCQKDKFYLLNGQLEQYIYPSNICQRQMSVYLYIYITSKYLVRYTIRY